MRQIETDCDLAQGFCTSCKHVAADQQILMKLVFGCKQESATRHMLQHENPALTVTIRVLECDEIGREAKIEHTDRCFILSNWTEVKI